MTYSLEKLLGVRVLREDRARSRLARDKAELARARVQKQQKHEELVHYRQWRINEEKRLLSELKSKQASPYDLLLFNDTTNSLRQNQAAKVQQLAAAGQAVETAEKNLVRARRNYFTANRKKTKIEEHKSLWTEARHLVEEQAREKEMEEHVTKPGPGACL